MKKLIAAVITVGVVTLGTAGVAAAQQTGGSTSPTTQAGTNVKHPRRGTQRAALRIVAKTLGAQPRVVVTGLCGGQTLAQIAAANGKSASDLTSALVKAADARIEKAEKAGKITSSQASQRESTVSAKITQLVNSYQPSATRCQRLQSGSSATTPTS